MIFNLFLSVFEILYLKRKQSVLSEPSIINKESKKNLVWTKCGTKETNIGPFELSKKLRSLNVGEIMINSIDRDGMMNGYDLKLSKEISGNLDIPVITCGGAGNFQHLVELFKKTDVSGAACASIFHFGEVEIPALKQ